MKNIVRGLQFLFCLFFWESARAEHQTYLRGIVNLPGMQAALLEIHHTLSAPGSPPGINMTTSRFARAAERFEDQTFKGDDFQFEVLEIDLAKETVKTREAGKEYTYTLTAAERPANAANWVDLQNASFNDFTDLYSDQARRVLLQHPAIERAPITFKVAWTNQASEKAEVETAFVKRLGELGISVVTDGEKFLQLLPGALKQQASVRSKDLPKGGANLGVMSIENADFAQLAGIYGGLSGRHLSGSEPIGASGHYLKISQPLSKPELMYALETMFAWDDKKILLGDDDTFTIVPVSRRP